MAAPKPGGFKMSLGGLKAKGGLKASPAQKDAKKPRLLLGDDEPDDSNKQQEITGWDAAEGGALDANGKKEKEGPRIIPALPNRDWRAEARRKQLAKAPHQQAQTGAVDEKQMEEPKVHYGLTIIKKDEPQENAAAEADAPEPEKDNLTEEQRLEKKALDALINGKSTDNDLVIPVQTEEEAFLNDLHNAPEAPTLEAYEATPIEGFGAALLRGMGWKDGESIGKNGATAAKPKEVKRRPALLGIGAKEEAAVGIELGGRGGGKGKGKKVAQSYNPVTLRNKKTGEMISEEELRTKLEMQDMVQDEKPSKGSSKYDDDSEDERRREKRGERRDDREYDSERRRDKERRRNKDDYYDSDRRRDRRKDSDHESERRKDRHRDRSRDDRRRDRTRSPNDRKDKPRDRYRSRSRSRDSKRKSDRRERSRSRDDEERRKRRRREREYDDEREDRKKRSRDERYYK
jgi:hypothetical protein